jgi:hypothetical protein
MANIPLADKATKKPSSAVGSFRFGHMVPIGIARAKRLRFITNTKKN